MVPSGRPSKRLLDEDPFSTPTNTRKTRVHQVSSYHRQDSGPSSSVLEYGQLRTDLVANAELEDIIIMAIDRTSKGDVGCAYYVPEQESLYCMQDVQNADPETIEILKTDIQPTTLIVSTRFQDQHSLNGREKLSATADAVEIPPLPYEIIVRPNTDFKYENALAKLANVAAIISEDSLHFLIPGENAHYDGHGDTDETGLVDQSRKLLAATSGPNADSKLSGGCVGAVLGFLHRRRASEFLLNDPAGEFAYRVSKIETFTIKNTMMISPHTLSSLQIIQSESHPNLANQGPGSSGNKESLSVYGLFHHLARTSQGRCLLRRKFLRPSLDRAEIKRRHDFVSITARPENYSICQTISNNLSRVKNLRNTLILLRKGIEKGSNARKINSGVWATILEFCYQAIKINNLLGEIVDLRNLDLGQRARNVFDDAKLQTIGKMVFDVVDLDLSLEQHRSIIKHGVDEDLDQVKDSYDRLEELLSTIAIEVTNEMPKEIHISLNVVFLPQLGYHIVVPLDEVRRPVWDGGGEQWERRFSTEQNMYFKSRKMLEMDDQWGDLYAAICDREIEISHGLAQRVIQNETFLIKVSDFCGELDSLLALTHGAHRYNLNRPEMSEENIIDIKSGRHILQELTVASYVSNDTYIVQHSGVEREGPSMLLLTGPNYSGKTIYKKQVALIVYLAQIGSFVPAQSAVLGITDKILTRINTSESVSKHQSAFVIDIQQIAVALKASTAQSLILIDEFGKGTDTCDGAGLASGIFRYLLELGPQCPRVLASTHFHEIFEIGDFHSYSNLKFCHMEIQMTQSQPTDAIDSSSHVTYLYNLREGRSALSYGDRCALINGVPKRVVRRATMLTELMVQGTDLVAACSSLPEDELDELQVAEDVSRRFLSQEVEAEAFALDPRGYLEQWLSAQSRISDTTDA